MVIKNCSLFDLNKKWFQWQKEIGDIRNGLAHNSFQKIPEQQFLNELEIIKRVLDEIDQSENLSNNAIFKMAQVLLCYRLNATAWFRSKSIK